MLDGNISGNIEEGVAACEGLGRLVIVVVVVARDAKRMASGTRAFFSAKNSSKIC